MDSRRDFYDTRVKLVDSDKKDEDDKDDKNDKNE